MVLKDRIEVMAWIQSSLRGKLRHGHFDAGAGTLADRIRAEVKFMKFMPWRVFQKAGLGFPPGRGYSRLKESTDAGTDCLL